MEKKESFFYEDCSESKDKVACIKKLSQSIYDDRDALLRVLGRESAKAIIAMSEEVRVDWTSEKEEEEIGKILDAPYQFLGGKDSEIVGKELVRWLPENIKKKLFDKGILH